MQVESSLNPFGNDDCIGYQFFFGSKVDQYDSIQSNQSSPITSFSKSCLCTYTIDNNENEHIEIDPNQIRKRSYFSREDDHLLTLAVSENYNKKWKYIASFVPGKTPKQCRDRWTNYLQPSLKFSPWTRDEDIRLTTLVEDLGTHWTKMKKFFPGRSLNSIKNRWYWLIKNPVFMFFNKKETNKKSNKKIEEKQKKGNEQHQLEFNDMTFDPSEFNW